MSGPLLGGWLVVGPVLALVLTATGARGQDAGAPAGGEAPAAVADAPAAAVGTAPGSLSAQAGQERSTEPEGFAVGAASQERPAGAPGTDAPAAGAPGTAEPAAAPAEDGPPPSRWYLERGTERRRPRPEDDIPEVADLLAGLLRDQRVPGFYDGQFAATVEQFDELARLARDPTVDHTLRMMAIMALQEAGDGEALAAVLEPLLVPAGQEFQMELAVWWDNGRTTEEGFVREVLAADLSRHARFALAKDGQPDAVLAKIEEMKRYVQRDESEILDPLIRSIDDPRVALKRDVWFDVAYHYQQYDDFENAADWFRRMADSLNGAEATWCHYNLACIAAIQGHADLAMERLRRAVAAGFSDVGWMQEDGDLSSLRDRADWRELVLSMGGTPAEPSDPPGNSNGGAPPAAPGASP